MDINNNDVKLFESQRLTDEEDVGDRVSRLTVKNLFALSKAANKTMTLTLPDNRQFTVIFDCSNGTPIEAQQFLPFAYPEDSDQYLTYPLIADSFNLIKRAGEK